MAAAEGLEKYLRDHAREIQRRLPQIALTTTPTEVHDLRVLIRQFRSVLWLHRRDLKRKTIQTLNRELRQLGRNLGGVREMDVAVGDAKTYHLPLRALQIRRQQRRIRLQQWMALHGKKVSRALFALTNENPLRLSRQSRRQRLRKMIHQLHHGRHSSDRHRLRIRVKRARYLLEALGKNAKPLKNLQTVLGKIHDLQVLSGFTDTSEDCARDLKRWLKKEKELRPKSLQWATAHLSIENQ